MKGEIKKIILIFSVRKSQNSNKEEKNFITLPRYHFVNEISNQPTARLSEKLYCNWIIMLVTMATLYPHTWKVKIVSSLRVVKIWFLVKGEILVFHQYLYNKYIYHMASFASSQDEPNIALWLAAQASKMERYCPLGIELELGQYPAILTSRFVHMNIYT